MLIGGLQKFTVLDYPDKIAATVFTVFPIPPIVNILSGLQFPLPILP